MRAIVLDMRVAVFCFVLAITAALYRAPFDALAISLYAVIIFTAYATVRLMREANKNPPK